MKIYNNVLELIGKTPLIKINNLSNNSKANIFAKVEFFNPLSSVKDRIALAMIETAEKEGKIDEKTIIIEPTSGNTGIGLAGVCAVKGYKLILTMPDTMSIERRKLLRILGAEIVLTPGAEGMKGAINKASELMEEYGKKAFMPQQFKNKANPEIHKKTTAIEIWNDTNGKVDIFVAGVGTGGTLTGVASVLKEKNPNIKIIAVEPENSAVISGEGPGSHKIQGIGAGFIPDVLDKNIIDEVIKVSNDNAFEIARMLPKREGLFVGISSGAAMYAALRLAEQEENAGKNIIVILPDTGERYLSMPFWDEKI